MRRYRNPIIPNSPKGNTWDPYVLRYGGYYYHCFSNNEGVFISKAKELWDIGKGELCQIYDCSRQGALKDWYAPELHRIGDTWYVYASPDFGQGLHTMAVLSSREESPMGNYEYRGRVKGLEDQWNLDGTVMYCRGELYFVWSTCSALYLAKMADPCAIIGEITLLSKPEYEFETHVGLVIEGPALLYRNGKIHIVYSANDSKYDEYCLGLLTFSGQGSVLDSACWYKSSQAVFKKTESIFGPGHCSFTTVTENGAEQDYIVYHANTVSGSGWSGRNVFTQPFYWDEHDLPVFGKPEF